ncbi:hypothetical protein SLEP1_g39367 [Rubroshorea leprosula]|uniref:TF-B3 domain-containing protein n=1 Tax=Rubroshorea leprosula TaxID=152421 RepID=A0AAV5L0S2_9ROSI|nr:hypothetical protein SLEP1_g39367 [Rubroshorea leprosula]
MASFEKVLTETDINEMLVIPTHFMNNLPANDGGHSVNVTVDASGVQRTFGYYTRRDANRRPVFRTGWRNYVRDKGLRAGDRIIFECVDGFPRYRIRAQRQMFLFGEEMWGDI